MLGQASRTLEGVFLGVLKLSAIVNVCRREGEEVEAECVGNEN